MPWPDVRPLFEWAIRLADPPALVDSDDDFIRIRRAHDPDFEDLRDSVDELAAEFRASRFGQRSIEAGLDVHENLEDLIWFGVSDGHARPTRWGKWRVFKFLVSWVHDFMLQPPDEVVALPELLRFWIEYAHEREGLHESQSRPVFHELFQVAPLFRSQLDERVAAVFSLLDELDLSDEVIDSELA